MLRRRGRRRRRRSRRKNASWSATHPNDPAVYIDRFPQRCGHCTRLMTPTISPPPPPPPPQPPSTPPPSMTTPAADDAEQRRDHLEGTNWYTRIPLYLRI